jgi:hypothetical protein
MIRKPRNNRGTGSEAVPRTAGGAPARRPTPWSNALVFVVTVLIVFGAAEIGFRIFYHPENLGSVIRFDKVLGWSLEPSATLRSMDNSEGLDYRIRTNSVGMREREFDVTKKPGTKRILIIGDSIAFGTGVDAEWRFSDFLSRSLGPDVEVLNAGVSGWGPDQELLYYETRGRELHPDVVILTFTMANDVINDMLDHLFLGSAPKPRFVLSDGNLSLEQRVLEPPNVGTGHRVRGALKKSRLLLFIKRRIDARRYESRVKREVSQSVRGFDKEGLEKNYSHWSVYETAYPPKFEDAFRVTEAIVARFAADCSEDGAKFMLFAFPLKIEVDEPWRRAMIEHAGIDSTLFDFARPHKRLSAFCASRGIDYIYPVETFRDAARSQRLYFDRDTHPNGMGHALAAGVLLRELHERLGLSYHVVASDRDYLETALISGGSPPGSGPSGHIGN